MERSVERSERKGEQFARCAVVTNMPESFRRNHFRSDYALQLLWRLRALLQHAPEAAADAAGKGASTGVAQVQRLCAQTFAGRDAGLKAKKPALRSEGGKQARIRASATHATMHSQHYSALVSGMSRKHRHIAADESKSVLLPAVILILALSSACERDPRSL